MLNIDDDGKIWLQGSSKPEYGVRVGDLCFVIGQVDTEISSCFVYGENLIVDLDNPDKKYRILRKFPFNLKNTENISTKEDKYKRSLVNYSTLTDHSGLHMEVKSIRETRQMITLNTDWISEYYVKQIEELILSEYVWLERPTGNPQPVNVKTSKYLKKNHLNDKLINYTIEIEAAPEYINTIR